MRPRRVYKNQKGRYYYLVKGKKKFIKTPKDINDKKMIKINIKNLTVGDTSKKIKRRKKRRTLKYGKNITKDMKPLERATSGTVTASPQLPVYLFEPQKNIESIITSTMKKGEENKKDEDIKKLKDEILLLKNEPHNIKGTVETEKKKPKKPVKGAEETKEEKKPKKPAKGAEETKGEEKEEEEEIVTKNPIASKSDEKGVTEYEKQLEGDYNSQLLQIINTFLKSYTKLNNKDDTIKTKFKTFLSINYPNTDHKKNYEGPAASAKKVYIIKNLIEIVEQRRKIDGYENKVKQLKENIPAIASKFFTGREIRNIKYKPLRDDFSNFLKKEYNHLYYDDEALKILTGELFNEEYEKKLKSISGSGKGEAESHALWNTEIEHILKKTIKPDFVPVIASDKCDELYDHVYEGMPDFSFIMNTAKSTSDGSTDGHWVACYIDNNDDYKSIEYYDPLAGGRPSKSLITCLRKLASIINPEYTFLYKQNNLKQQADTTDTCGYFAVRFLELRNNHIPFSEATGYDAYVEKMKPDESVVGEGIIQPIVKKYNSYI